MPPTITIWPNESMFDYGDLQVKVAGLSGRQNVTIICGLTNPAQQKFHSYGHYVADINGCVDLREQPALTGTYPGVDPMGLIWSLQPDPGQQKGTALMPSDVFAPIDYFFTVIDGHQKPEKFQNATALCDAFCRRRLLHPDIERIVVETGRIRGTLFRPKGANALNKCSAVIDLYGTRGGVNEHRAALLSSHGYASFALAYFAYKDLPKSLDIGLDIEYFEEAASWLLRQDYIRDDGVSIIGASLGADIGLILASVCPLVKSVIAINGFHMLNEQWPFKYRNVTLPFFSAPFTSEFLRGDDLDEVDMRAYRSTLFDDPKCIYQIEKSSAQFLLVCGELDGNTDSVKTGEILMRRLREHGKSQQGEMLVLQGAGHLLEPPFLPHIPLGFSRPYGMYVRFGGEKIAHAKGQGSMWRKVFEHLQTYLGSAFPMQKFAKDHQFSSKL